MAITQAPRQLRCDRCGTGPIEESATTYGWVGLHFEMLTTSEMGLHFEMLTTSEMGYTGIPLDVVVLCNNCRQQLHAFFHDTSATPPPKM